MPWSSHRANGERTRRRLESPAVPLRASLLRRKIAFVDVFAGTGRWAGVLAACAAIGCTHESTSDYGIAAAFAAAAGAVEVAEAAQSRSRASECGPATCNGCCDVAGVCVTGAADDACGAAGSICRNCAASGHQACGDGVCASPGTGNASSSLATAPVGGGAVPLTPGATPQRCVQAVVFCFPRTSSVCLTDGNGCAVCSCTPDARADQD